MAKAVLAINAGSSSVKVSVYAIQPDSKGTKAIAEVQISGLTDPPSRFKYSRYSEQICQDKEVDGVSGQDAALEYILEHLTNDTSLHEIKTKSDIHLACHRVVHGGDYDAPQVITKDTYHHIEALSDLAPLHNAPALQIIRSCVEDLPDTRNVAVFDSQFHQTMPPHIRTYPIDPRIAQKNKLQKYGFHGISYSFITKAVSDFIGKPRSHINLIVLHLGSGASACAIKQGESHDTSMGLTPLAGLPGATRSGSVDPSLVFHYAADVGKLSGSATDSIHISRAEDILNKQAGWKSLTGTTNFETITSSSQPAMKLAFDIFVDRICGFIGAYYVSLEGQVDALVFAGGIGEKSDRLRSEVVNRVSCLGFKLDEEANRGMRKDGVFDIGSHSAAHRTLVCHTDEQAEMIRQCVPQYITSA